MFRLVFCLFLCFVALLAFAVPSPACDYADASPFAYSAPLVQNYGYAQPFAFTVQPFALTVPQFAAPVYSAPLVGGYSQPFVLQQRFRVASPFAVRSRLRVIVR